MMKNYERFEDKTQDEIKEMLMNEVDFGMMSILEVFINEDEAILTLMGRSLYKMELDNVFNYFGNCDYVIVPMMGQMAIELELDDWAYLEV